MKILRLASATDLHLHPDSALIPEGRPMFYPDIHDSWEARFYLAIRINRLGKRISARFASRYYDAVALAVRIVPKECTGNSYETTDTPLAGGWLDALDNSITHGQWIPPTPDTFSDITVTINSTTATGLPSVNISAATTDIGIDEAVNLCSRYTTLRTGDIILLPLGSALPLLPRTRLTASSDLLNLKVV